MDLKSRFLIFSLVIVTAFVSQGAVLDSIRIESKNGKNFIIHKVEQGETLYSISRRYGAPLGDVVSQNKIVDNKIDLGQILEIPTVKEIKAPAVVTKTEAKIHIVEAKETLYSISRKYGITVDDIKTWNGLTSNNLSLGQTLKVGLATSSTLATETKNEPVIKVQQETVVETKTEQTKIPEVLVKAKLSDPEKEGFKVYHVQTGDVMEGIARKFNVRVDSIVIWNGLRNTYLSIGQKLLIRGELDSLAQTVEERVEKTEYSTVKKISDPAGFTKVIEEGVAKKIEDMESSEKYLALHRTLKIGTLVEVRNLMNNKKIFVRIVGKLPETGLNDNTLIRLSPISFKTLGVIDPLTRVEISYYEE